MKHGDCMVKPWQKFGVAGFLIMVLIISTLLAYANTFESPFVFDDFNVIVKNNPHLHIKELSVDAFKTLITKADGRKRPLSIITLALNYYYGGKNTFGYHVVNIKIHILTGIFLFFLLITIQRQAMKADEKALPEKPLPLSEFMPAGIAFLAALIWLLHPLQTNAVTYIVQRMTSLSAMFSILSLLLYIKGRIFMRAGRSGLAACLLAGCFLTGVGALLSKENGAMLPVCILLYEWYFFQNLRPIPPKHLLAGGLLVAVVMGVATYFFLGSSPLDRILAGYDQWNFTLPQRVLTEYRVIAFYFSLMAFPHPSRLMVDYDYPISQSFIDPPTTLISACLVLMLVIVAVYSAKKHRLFSFCLLWFLINLVIESSIIGIEIIYEHRLYLPSMMIFFISVYLACHHIRRKWAAAAGILVVALVLGTWTYQRNQVWASDIKFWQDCAHKSPKDARPIQNLAYALAQKGRHEQAVRYYRQSLILDNHPVTYFNIGVSLTKMKRHIEAVVAYQQAIDLKYNTSVAYAKLAHEQVMIGELEDALKNYQQSVNLNPKNRKAKQEFRKLSQFVKQCRTKQSCLKLLCDEYPQNPELRFKLASVFASRQDAMGALNWLEQAYKKGFDDVERLEADTRFDPFRQMPRFKGLKARIEAAASQKAADGL